MIINGIVWDIVLVEPNSRHLYTSYGTITLGCCDNLRHIIYINKRLNIDMFYRVLIHEISHACLESYGVEINEEQEEEFCQLMERYGNTILDNADSVFYRFANEKGVI